MKKNETANLAISPENKIDAISAEIKTIKAKLEIGSRDWNKNEKEAIATAYFEITKISTLGSTGNPITGGGLASSGFTGKGRVVDTGCTSCIDSAVTIIINYLAAIGTPVVPKLPKQKSAANPVVNKSNDDEGTGSAAAGINDDEMLFIPEDKNWRKNHDSISAAAKELKYEFAENEVTKQERITALEKYITTINED